MGIINFYGLELIGVDWINGVNAYVAFIIIICWRFVNL